MIYIDTIMKLRYFILSVVLLVLSCCSRNEKPSPADTLHSLFDKEWAFRIHEFPLAATYMGDTTRNSQIESLAPADMLRREEFYADLGRELAAIDTAALEYDDKINYRLFAYYTSSELDYYTFKSYRIPILADDGFHISFSMIPSITPSNTIRDYENYIARLKEFSRYANENIFWMRQGITDGFTMPRVVLDGYETTIRSHLVEDIDESVFFKPFLDFPDNFPETIRHELAEKGSTAIRQSVIGGYRDFLAFMTNEYIPACRETIGAYDLPDGEAYYHNRVRYYTTGDLTVDEIHDQGLREVDRILREMETVMRNTGFRGDRKAFLDFLRTDPRFYATSPEMLLKEAAFIAKKMDGKLPSLFGKLPRQPYGVAPVPSHIAPKYTSGRYVPAPAGGTEPGYYWVNTYDLRSRPLYALESLTLHEAVPGHHLQIALTQEMDNLPRFRQQLYVDTFGEGWGLYAEWLGIEAGFYKDPYSAFGRLTYEMWRACRLVVDTGIHAKGWTRQQAIDYLSEHTALSLHECTTETDRYISWPGQALAYKIGEMKIREMRVKAEQALGARFDVREFHDLVLSQGTVTLSILELMVDRYISTKKSGGV